MVLIAWTINSIVLTSLQSLTPSSSLDGVFLLTLPSTYLKDISACTRVAIQAFHDAMNNNFDGFHGSGWVRKGRKVDVGASTVEKSATTGKLVTQQVDSTSIRHYLVYLSPNCASEDAEPFQLCF